MLIIIIIKVKLDMLIKGMSLVALEKYDLAILMLDIAIRLDPNVAD